MLKLLIDKSKMHLDPEDTGLQQAVGDAIQNGSTAVVEKLLATNKFNHFFDSQPFRKAFRHAIEYGHDAMVQLLLNAGEVSLDLKDKELQIAVRAAIEKGHGATVKVLLDTGKLDLNFHDKDLRVAVIMAATNGYVAMIKTLLETFQLENALLSKDFALGLKYAIETEEESMALLFIEIAKVRLDRGDEELLEEIRMGDLYKRAKDFIKFFIKVLLDTRIIDVVLGNEHLERELKRAIEEETGPPDSPWLNSNSDDESGKRYSNKSAVLGHATLQRRRKNVLNLIELRKQKPC